MAYSNEAAHAAITEVVLNGLRWSSNIVVELLSNYGMSLPAPARKELMTATRALQGAMDEIRAEKQFRESEGK
jgi:hypothetical protein